MIDLSVTKDPKWIKAREKLWKPIGKRIAEDLRKDELEGVHHYFMTGKELPGHPMGDGASISWFPIQTPEAWDYLFQYSVKDEREFIDRFYFSFCDLSNRALNSEQELAMWDYFAGDVFQPEVTSRVPVGQKGEKVSFKVDKALVASHFCSFFYLWAVGIYKGESPNQVHRINYYFSLLKTLANEDFFEKASNGFPVADVGRYVFQAFLDICHPQYSKKFTSQQIETRKQFFEFLYNHFENMDMPSEMRTVWEKAKKGEIK